MKNKIKAVQSAINTPPDGKAGPHTWDLLYRLLVPDIKYPYEGYFWGAKVILARPGQFNVAYTPGKNAVSTGSYKYAVNGTFFDYATKKVVSLLGDKHGVHGWYSCRAWAGFPETVLYYDGVSIKSTTAKYAGELSGARWFIGGVDLINYRPEREGFCKFTHDGKPYDYRNVLNANYHACFGVDRLGVLHAFLAYGTAKKMAEIAKNLMLVHAVMCDGGSPCSMNSPSLKHKNSTLINNVIHFD